MRAVINSLICLLCLLTMIGIFLPGCAQDSADSPEDEDPVSDDENTDKFSLWENPSHFRGAAMHPYTCLGCDEEFRTYMTTEDFQDLKGQGANVVSLNYPGPYQVDAPYDVDETALEYLDNAVNWAEENGLYAILHFRNGPGKSEDSFGGGDDETLWYSDEAQEKWVEMWQFVADRYKDRSHVVAYRLGGQLLNRDISLSCLRFFWIDTSQWLVID